MDCRCSEERAEETTQGAYLEEIQEAAGEHRGRGWNATTYATADSASAREPEKRPRLSRRPQHHRRRRRRRSKPVRRYLVLRTARLLPIPR